MFLCSVACGMLTFYILHELMDWPNENILDAYVTIPLISMGIIWVFLIVGILFQW